MLILKSTDITHARVSNSDIRFVGIPITQNIDKYINSLYHNDHNHINCHSKTSVFVIILYPFVHTIVSLYHRHIGYVFTLEMPKQFFTDCLYMNEVDIAWFHRVLAH